MGNSTGDMMAIYNFVNERFTMQELEALCSRLGVNFAGLPGTEKPDKVRGLLLLMNQQGRLEELATTAHALKAEDLKQPEPVKPAGVERPTANSTAYVTAIYQVLDEGFNLSEIKDLCFQLGVEYEDLGGSGKSDKIRELIQYLERRNRLPALQEWVRENRPDITWPGSEPTQAARPQVVSQPVMDQHFVDEDEDEVEVEEQVVDTVVEPAEYLPQPYKITLQEDERFLSSTDRKWLVDNIGGLSEFMTLQDRRNLLIASEIPDRWIGRITLDGSTSGAAANIINDLETRGRLPKNHKKHALGSLIQTVAMESFGYEDGVKAMALIVRYQLNEDHEELNQLSEQFGVPLPTFDEDPYQPPRQQPQVSLPAGLSRVKLRENLQALHANGQKNWLDVEFLEGGARAARSVCRLEWGRKGEGTGFLVAPDLVLTNYHVIEVPQGVQQVGGLEGRLQKCSVRFGAAMTQAGGNKVVKLHQDALVSASPTDKLDYALLRLEEPVEDKERIIKAEISEEAISPEQYANIIQHPLGGTMKVALRYNQVVQLATGRVYYLSDTLKGSSGSPVFDDFWQVIALHRAGALRDENGQVVLEANEGVPILDIMAEIREHLP